MRLSNKARAMAFAPLVLGATFVAQARADGWQENDASYWLPGNSRTTLEVTEFTPKKAPHYTCVVVHSSNRTVAINCLPKIQAVPPEGTPAHDGPQ